MAHELVISYSTKDQLIAETVCEFLERKGVPCWMAPRDITGSDDWDEAIFQAIEDARMVLLVLSSKSNHSKYVKRELMHAVARGRDILPLRIEDVEPSKKLRFALGTHQWVDAFPKPLVGYLDKVASDIRLRLVKLASESPEITILSPQPGERWTPGERHVIRWEIALAADCEVEELEIDLYCGSEEVLTIADSHRALSPRSREFAWQVPAGLDDGRDYQIRIDCTDDEERPGCARANFTLLRPAAAAPLPIEKQSDGPTRNQQADRNEPAATTPPPAAAAPAQASAEGSEQANGVAAGTVQEAPASVSASAAEATPPKPAEAPAPAAASLAKPAVAPDEGSWQRYLGGFVLVPGFAVLVGAICGVAGGAHELTVYLTSPAPEAIEPAPPTHLQRGTNLSRFKSPLTTTPGSADRLGSSPFSRDNTTPGSQAARMLEESTSRPPGANEGEKASDPLPRPLSPPDESPSSSPFSKALREAIERGKFLSPENGDGTLKQPTTEELLEKAISDRVWKPGSEPASPLPGTSPSGEKPAADPLSNNPFLNPKTDPLFPKEQPWHSFPRDLFPLPEPEPPPLTWSDHARRIWTPIEKGIEQTLSGLAHGAGFGALVGTALGVLVGLGITAVSGWQRRSAEVVMEEYTATTVTLLFAVGGVPAVVILFGGFDAQYSGLIWGLCIGAVAAPLLQWLDIKSNRERQESILKPAK